MPKISKENFAAFSFRHQMALVEVIYQGALTLTGFHKWGRAHQTSKHLPKPNL